MTVTLADAEMSQRILKHRDDYPPEVLEAATKVYHTTISATPTPQWFKEAAQAAKDREKREQYEKEATYGTY